MTRALKVIVASAATILIAGSAAAAYYVFPKNSSSRVEASYTLTATAGEQCGGGKGVKLFLNEPCQIFLDAYTLGEDPRLTVNWYEITGAKKLLVSDSEAPFSYSFAGESTLNGTHKYIAELIKKDNPGQILAVSNPLEIEIKILTMGCETGRESFARIEDANLKLAIRQAIAKETGTELKDEVECVLLQSLTKLDASRKNIHSLVGLEHAIALQDLNLAENSIADFSPIAALKELTILNLNNTGIADITLLGGLEKLKELYLGNNQIKSIESLTRLSNLKLLSLGKNALENISSLVKIPNVAAGNLFTIVRNPLNWTPGSDARKIVEALKQKAVTVDFDDLSLSLVAKPVGGSPSQNIKIEEGNNVEFTAKAELKGTVAEAKIEKIELFENGKLLVEMKAPNYKHVVRVSVGSFEYFARVTTNDRAFAETPKITVLGEKKKETPVPPISLPPLVPTTTPVTVVPPAETCLTPYMYCDPGDPEHNVPASCALGLENPSCGIPIVICDGAGCHKNDPQKTPFSFDDCPEVKKLMKLGSNRDISGSQVPLPANKTCGGENFCKRILLCAR